MAVEGRCLLTVHDEAAHPAVELPGEQQADDEGLDVLPLILVSVEGILQVRRDVICKKDDTTFEYSRAVTNDYFFFAVCEIFININQLFFNT